MEFIILEGVLTNDDPNVIYYSHRLEMSKKKTPIKMSDPISALIGRELNLMDQDPIVVEEKWVEARNAYPKRYGGQNFVSAKRVFMDWVYNHGVEPDRMIAGIKGFAEEAVRTKLVGTRFVPHMETFLRQSRYENYIGSEDRNCRISEIMRGVSGV